MEVRISRNPRKPLIVFALMLASLANWLTLPGSTRWKAVADSRGPNISSRKPAGTTQTWVNEVFGRLPLSFEANQGQFDSCVKFLSRAAGHTVYLTSTEAVLQLYSRTEAARNKESVVISGFSRGQRPYTADATSAVLRMRLIGATLAQDVDGLDERPGKSNYFIGNDPKEWRTGVKSYSKVRYRSVYPGIDLVYHSDQRDLEYDFKVAPGANPGTIRLAFDGANRMRLDKSGDLVLSTSCGEVRQRKPTVFQEVLGIRKRIAASYVMRGKDQFGFRVSRYDQRKPLIIDPVLLYSTYLGGSGLDNAQAVAVDTNGNAYITGSTTSTNFPTANPIQPAIGGFPTSDVFITKLNPTGTALVYSTYLGGSSSDSGFGIALDGLGNAYVTGQATSIDFPTVNPFQIAAGGLPDAFVTKLNPQGSMLVYSSYLGGAFNDLARAITVDSVGAAYITGNTSSPDFPLANPLRSTIGGNDAFVSKINPAGTALVYSTFLGGSGSDTASAIALDSTRSVYVTGTTRSQDFPTLNALQPNFSDKTLFKSTDSGASWAVINNGVPRNESGLTLAIDPLNTATVYAGTDTSTYKSTDAGGHWMPASEGFSFPTGVTYIAVDPVTPSNLYAATALNVYKSTNSGASWQSILDTVFNRGIAIDPVNPLTVYVGASTQGVLVTTDGGDTWENTDFPLANARVNSLEIDPAHSGSVYVGTDSYGIHRYPASCANIPASLSVRCVAVSPASPSTVYIGTGLVGIYKSTDAGGTWNITGAGPIDIATIAVDPVDSAIVYAGARSICYKSIDGGESWTPLPVSPQAVSISVNKIVVDPANPSTLYAAALGGGEAYVTKLSASGGAYVYSTLLGGSGSDSGAAIAVDSSNAVYLTGTTNSLDIPSANSLRPFGGSSDIMITKLTPDGSLMSFFSYFGGANQETAAAISIDSSGNVWVTGNTNSADLPITPDAIPVINPCPQSSCQQAFVSKFNSNGTLLAYSTYLGGTTPPTPFQSTAGARGFGVAIDHTGSAYVVGQTFAVDFPTTPAAFQVNSGGGTSDAFVAKIGFPCAYSLSRTSQAFPSAGGSGSVDLTTAIGCAWTAVSSDSWIFLTSADSGDVSEAITFELRENFGDRSRIGTLTIAGQTFTVLQEGLASSGCSNTISPVFGSFPSIGGISSINVVANDECLWTAVSNRDWVTITSNYYAIGAGVVSYTVAVNPGTAARKAKITVAGQIYAIKQKGNATNGRPGVGKP